MATTGAGNPYVESSDLVANYPAVSETLAERLDVIGVNPFASAAARSSAIPSPTEGMMSSLNDDDKVYRYDGSAWVAVGTSALTLVSPTSIANSGGSASASGGEIAFTGVSSVSVNGVFTSTHDNYLILSRVTQSTNDANNFRLRVAGTDSTASYQYATVGLNSNGGAANTNSNSATRWDLYGADFSSHVINLFNPNLAVPTNGMVHNLAYTTVAIAGAGGFYHNVSTAYDGFTLFPNYGTFTGKLRVYGYQKL